MVIMRGAGECVRGLGFRVGGGMEGSRWAGRLGQVGRPAGPSGPVGQGAFSLFLSFSYFLFCFIYFS